MVNRPIRQSAMLILALSIFSVGVAQASQLLSTHASYHPQERFAILVLRFDGKTPHQYLDLQNGVVGQITLRNCAAEKDVIAALSAVNNDLIQKAETSKRNSDLIIALRFNQAAKIKIRETQNPYSLIFHISPGDAPQKVPPKTPAEKGKGGTNRNRNRLADSEPLIPSKTNPEADKARQLAVFFDQMGDSAGEIQQWETFFRTVLGGDSLLAGLTSEEEEQKELSQAEMPSQPEVAAQKQASPPQARGGFPYELLLSILILAMGVVTVGLYLRQREMNRAIRALLQDQGSGKVSAPQQALAKADQVLENAPAPAGDSNRPADDTAREVLALYRTGMAIPAIAEKMQMGQDEIRLILNLAREEKATVT